MRRPSSSSRPASADRFTTITNVIVILALFVVALSDSGPIRPRVENWMERVEDRKVARANWSIVSEGSSASQGGGFELVVAVEFIDYQCPFCRRMEDTKREFGLVGATVVTRHLPLESIHTNAKLAAHIAICAEVMMPWAWPEVHQGLYGIADSLTAERWPEQLDAQGLPGMAALASCVDSDLPRKRVEEDRRYAETFGSTGTPGYIFPNAVYRGAMEGKKWTELLRAAKNELTQ